MSYQGGSLPIETDTHNAQAVCARPDHTRLARSLYATRYVANLLNSGGTERRDRMDCNDYYLWSPI